MEDPTSAFREARVMIYWGILFGLGALGVWASLTRKDGLTPLHAQWQTLVVGIGGSIVAAANISLLQAFIVQYAVGHDGPSVDMMSVIATTGPLSVFMVLASLGAASLAADVSWSVLTFTAEQLMIGYSWLQASTKRVR